MAISAILTHRAMSALSKRSQSVPDAPEKRKNGAMKSALATIASDPASRPERSASRYATRMPSALFSRLSLNAPRNCVANKGANRRAVMSQYECGVAWLCLLLDAPRRVVTAAHAAAVTSRSQIEPSSKGSRPYAANVTGCSTTPKMRAVARSGPWDRDLAIGDPAVEDCADDVNRCWRAWRQLRQLAVLHEQQESEERRVVVVRLAEAADHGGHFLPGGRLVSRQRLERHRERNVVPLECLPDEVILALEVAVERTLGQANRHGDVPDGGLGDPFCDEQSDCGLFDAVTRVGKSVSRHSE